MLNDFLKTTEELSKGKDPFAMAFIVNRNEPSSGKPGDKAIITKDGSLIGWIGGGCTRGIVIKEATQAISDGKPRLVRISPEGTQVEEEGVRSYKMTCYSGGTVEVYIEPVLPKPHLLILGRSHVAMALARLGKAMGYVVTVAAAGIDSKAFPEVDQLINETAITQDLIMPNTCIIVSTQGENDEIALEQALNTGALYISFISSRLKASGIFADLRKKGFGNDQLKRIKTPAGIDINAKLPEEVAISILGEIISLVRSSKFHKEVDIAKTDVANNDSDNYVNPVCDIIVQKSTAKHVIEYQGEKYYFCCDGCKVVFEKEPEKYAVKSH